MGVDLVTMAQTAHKLRHPERVKVGDRVGVQYAGRLLGAEVIEDRGPLGPRGQQVVRLSVGSASDSSDCFEVEVPVEWLEPAPRS
jgi:hypothetical protein